LQSEIIQVTQSNDLIVSVFVYGTLKRGQCRESSWPSKPLRITESWIQGNLFGRRDYPALMPGENRVRGEMWVYDIDTIDPVIEVLDRIEGTNRNSKFDLYHRHLVDVFTADGKSEGPAFTYFYNRDPIANRFMPVPLVDGHQIWPDDP
jgi:gamma-glutamylcyclotransferase (GGCT)/AIG2-like uncharacterized protein YtfP